MNAEEDVRRRVAELLETGLIGDAPALEGARILDPIAVADPAGRLHSWFVPVALAEMLAGFAELQPDLELVRYSSSLGRSSRPTGSTRRRSASTPHGSPGPTRRSANRSSPTTASRAGSPGRSRRPIR